MLFVAKPNTSWKLVKMAKKQENCAHYLLLYVRTARVELIVTCFILSLLDDFVQVDIYEYKSPTYIFQWMGRHSLSIFVLVASNIAVIAIQGFYWRNPENNIVSLTPITSLDTHSKTLHNFHIPFFLNSE